MANVIFSGASRFNIIDLNQLGRMVVLEDLDSEDNLSDRMLKFKAVWTEHDPPAGAEYDVENLEFDPIKICQECNAYFETLLRDRINQAARAVTLAYAISTDLDAIATRTPVGPRQTLEDGSTEGDLRYRRRTQLSWNPTSPHGASGAYMYWALTADSGLKDATEVAIEGTGQVIVTCLDDNVDEPRPSTARLVDIRAYLHDAYRKAATDIVTVAAPKVTETDYKVQVWFYPPPDRVTLMARLRESLETLVENQRWLGFDHTRAAIYATLYQEGVHRIEILEPVEDIFVDPRGFVKVNSIEITYMGRSE
jgi:phage-related baseplate assembly protein